MAATTGLREVSSMLLSPARPGSACWRCRRMFATSPIIQSGHNKWSKIKHTKGRKDMIKTAARTQHVEAITVNSRLYGPDPNMNSALANAIALAKKASMPKDVIDNAIARGQGRSSTGATLQPMKFEVMMPSSTSTAFILDVETDNKLRALQDVGSVIRKHGGRTTATEFFFSRRGRVVFEKHGTLGVDDVMEDMIDFGAEDIESDDQENVVVWCAPAQTMQVAKGATERFSLGVLSSDILWSPNEETRATVEKAEDVKMLVHFVDALAELPEVQAIYSNAVKGDGVPEEEWAAFADSTDL